MRKQQDGQSRRAGWAAALLAAITLLLAACSGSSNHDAGVEAAPAMADREANVAGDAAVGFASGTEGGSPDIGITGGDPGTTGVLTLAAGQEGFNRMMIYRANLVLRVADYAAANEKLQDAIALSGGYIVQFTNQAETSGRGANYTIKVASGGLASFLERLRAIPHEELSENVEGTDVSEEYVDLEARLKAKQTTEARYLAFMDKATGTDDLVRYANELARVQEEIERIKGRMRYLDQNVAYSTVTVRLYESAGSAAKQQEEKEGLLGRISGTMEASARVLRELGEGLLLVLAALLPVLAVAAVIGVPTVLLVRRRRKEKAAAAAQKRAWLNANHPSAERGPDLEEKERLESGAAPASDAPATAANAAPDATSDPAEPDESRS